ncbi:hypothetical protein AX15_004877 [Amanita polypyramis BW_CC]|nr:hypothetical protein AX15_004877 [Amanita polypyramis BW_CC]
MIHTLNPTSVEEEIITRVATGQKGPDNDQCEGALAPHAKLVEDVLRLIFAFACDGGELLQPDVVTSMAVTISHVSSPWRQIVLDMPHLWIYVCLDILRGPACAFGDYAENELARDKHKVMLTDTWLARGGSLPRTLTINTASRSACQRYFPDLAQRLVKQYPFNRLTFYLFWDQIGSLTHIPTTTLECLYVQVDENSKAVGASRDVTVPLPLPLPTEMPNLSELVLSAPHAAQWDIQALATIVPWRSMTRVELGIVVPSTMVFNVILQQGTSLRYCYALMNEDDALANGLTPKPLALAKMECLILYCANDQDTETFRRWVATPNAYHRRIDTKPREYRPDEAQN